MHKPLVLVTGASGFIGSQLLPFLLQQDYRVVGVTRQPNRVSKHPQLRWIQQLDELDTDQIDYVINLAGESIGQGRWTAARKQKLLDSRVQTTLHLYQYLEKRRIFPSVLFQARLWGITELTHRNNGLALCTEHSAAQDIFMSQLCQQWEQAALSFSQQNTKIMRLGVVFGARWRHFTANVITNSFKCCRADWAWTAACCMGAYTRCFTGHSLVNDATCRRQNFECGCT